MKQVEKALRRPITGILISIVMGFIVGAVVLGYNPAAAYASMISGIFSKPKYLVQVIIRATPLILTGLSISFAFKTGMFNIGAEGQAIMGMVAAVVVGYCIELPPLLHFIAVALSAIGRSVGRPGGWPQGEVRHPRGDLRHHAQLDRPVLQQLHDRNALAQEAPDRGLL